jgi:hypothetical protein
LCAELATALNTNDHYEEKADKILNKGLLDRVRAALTQPELEGPSESDISELFYRHVGEGSEVGFAAAIEEALERWAPLTPSPIPVTEKPWEKLGWCDEYGRCWMGRKRVGDDPGPCLTPCWLLNRPELTPVLYTESLPHWALKSPE